LTIGWPLRVRFAQVALDDVSEPDQYWTGQRLVEAHFGFGSRQRLRRGIRAGRTAAASLESGVMIMNTMNVEKKMTGIA